MKRLSKIIIRQAGQGGGYPLEGDACITPPSLLKISL